VRPAGEGWKIGPSPPLDHQPAPAFSVQTIGWWLRMQGTLFSGASCSIKWRTFSTSPEFRYIIGSRLRPSQCSHRRNGGPWPCGLHRKSAAPDYPPRSKRGADVDVVAMAAGGENIRQAGVQCFDISFPEFTSELTKPTPQYITKQQSTSWPPETSPGTVTHTHPPSTATPER
jgi:hypothetical protein